MLAIKRHATAVHINAKALTPSFAFWPFSLKAERPCTKTALFIALATRLHVKRHGCSGTYVIKEVTMIWNKRLRAARRAEIIPPTRMHMARKPVKKEMTPKNRAMISKGNMNRLVKK